MCPFCPHVGSVLARELGRSRAGLVKFGRARGWRCLIGLYLYRDWSIPLQKLAPEAPAPDAVTQRKTCW
jgi:hypothetical protein